MKPTKNTVSCEICGMPTIYFTIRLCSICHSLEKIVPRTPEEQQNLLQKINQYRALKEARGDV